MSRNRAVSKRMNIEESRRGDGHAGCRRKEVLSQHPRQPRRRGRRAGPRRGVPRIDPLLDGAMPALAPRQPRTEHPASTECQPLFGPDRDPRSDVPARPGQANDAFQRGVAETNAEEVVAACESYRADNGRFPRRLDQLVPRYLSSVPVAKYCLGPGRFVYSSSDNTGITKLFWYVAPPRLRKVYDFETRSWSHLE